MTICILKRSLRQKSLTAGMDSGGPSLSFILENDKSLDIKLFKLE